MGVVLEMTICIFIITKMYCIYDEQLRGNFIAFIAFTGFLAGTLGFIVAFARAVIIVANFSFV